MNKYVILLVKLGLPEKAAQIYITLLDKGALGIADIAKFGKLHRAEIYKYIPILLEGEFIMESILGKRKLYRASNPGKISELFENMKRTSSLVIQELEEKYKFIEEKPIVRFEKGAKYISQAFGNMISEMRQGEIFYRISSVQDIEKANSYLPKNYRNMRDEKQIERYAILSESTAQQKKPRLEREIAIMPENYEKFDEDITMILYHHKTLFIDYATESVATLENKKLTNFQKKLFTVLFKSLRK